MFRGSRDSEVSAMTAIVEDSVYDGSFLVVGYAASAGGVPWMRAGFRVDPELSCGAVFSLSLGRHLRGGRIGTMACQVRTYIFPPHVFSLLFPSCMLARMIGK